MNRSIGFPANEDSGDEGAIIELSKITDCYIEDSRLIFVTAEGLIRITIKDQKVLNVLRSEIDKIMKENESQSLD